MDPEQCPIGERPDAPYFFGASDAPFLKSTEDPFETLGWISHCRAAAEHLFQQRWAWIDYRQWARLLLYGHYGMQRHLYPLKNIISKKIKKEIKILDIGGGFGDNYMILRDAIGFKSPDVSYTVIDNNLSCELGRSIFPDCRFLTEIPDEEFDVAIIIGTLQYIPEWKKFLGDLNKKVDCIYIARTPVRNDGDTFYTQQAVCPALGASTLKKVGLANLAVISKIDIITEFEAIGWASNYWKLHADYSSQLKRLPSQYQNVSYYNMAWTRR